MQVILPVSTLSDIMIKSYFLTKSLCSELSLLRNLTLICAPKGTLFKYTIEDNCATYNLQNLTKRNLVRQSLRWRYHTVHYCKLLLMKENWKVPFPSSFEFNIFSKKTKMRDIYQLFQRQSHTFMCSKSMYYDSCASNKTIIYLP
jgi:hypothetical protein